MGIGTFVRHRLGRLEIPAANAYRGMFISLPTLARRVADRIPAKRILEVGCGDGSTAQAMLGRYPDAEYIGIDVAPTAGRLYRGDQDRAAFRTITIQDFHAEGHDPFDLVMFVDVIHHVPKAMRPEVVGLAADLIRPGGHLVVKEFERNRGGYYYATYAADRFITGDKGVAFLTLPELRGLLGTLEGFGPATESRIPRARNNILVTRQRLP